MYDLNLILYLVFGIPLIAAFCQLIHEWIVEWMYWRAKR